MAVDLTTVPWNRLLKLAPPGTKQDDLIEAAERYALYADVYAAAADLWEDAALAVDIAPECSTSDTAQTGAVQSVSQDGISVTYASDPLAGNGLSARVGARAQMLATAKRLRARSKPKSVLMHPESYDAWTGLDREDESQIIPIIE